MRIQKEEYEELQRWLDSSLALADPISRALGGGVSYENLPKVRKAEELEEKLNSNFWRDFIDRGIFMFGKGSYRLDNLYRSQNPQKGRIINVFQESGLVKELVLKHWFRQPIEMNVSRLEIPQEQIDRGNVVVLYSGTCGGEEFCNREAILLRNKSRGAYWRAK